MSFKYDGKKSHRWHQWLRVHGKELTAGGVPDSVLKTELDWLRFLDDDFRDYVTGWNYTFLSLDQARVLYAFVKREYGNQTHRSALRALEDWFEKQKAEYDAG